MREWERLAVYSVLHWWTGVITFRGLRCKVFHGWEVFTLSLISFSAQWSEAWALNLCWRCRLCQRPTLRCSKIDTHAVTDPGPPLRSPFCQRQCYYGLCGRISGTWLIIIDQNCICQTVMGLLLRTLCLLLLCTPLFSLFMFCLKGPPPHCSASDHRAQPPSLCLHLSFVFPSMFKKSSKIEAGCEVNQARKHFPLCAKQELFTGTILQNLLF